MTVSCAASVLSHRTGQAPEAPDISWPSSPIGTVSCTAFVQGTEGRGQREKKEEEWESEENQTTTTLTVGKNVIKNLVIKIL